MSVRSAKRNLQTRGHGLTRDFPRLLGERLCLDFANTVESPRKDPEEFLHDYADLARWSWHAHALDEGEARALSGLAQKNPEEAGSVFEHALQLRVAIDSVFRAVARANKPSPAAVRTIQDNYLDGLAQARLVRTGGRFTWSWAPEPNLRRVLWPVADSAIELLTVDDVTRVRECPGADDCGWLFYDTTRNRSRRWCSMEGCGSRVKMRRYYARSKS
jgi:predicted RNA-binding Zn ribbon-like protein